MTAIVGPKVVSFSGESSIISNLAPLSITLPCDLSPTGRETFGSNEHAYVWCKLTWMGLADDADRIRRISSPKAMMLASKSTLAALRGDETIQARLQLWRDKLAEPLLTDLAFVKAAQHPEFLNIILQNSHKVFLETTNDRFWGCGVNRAQAVQLSEEALLDRATGLNTFGKIVKSVATTLSTPAHLVSSKPTPPVLEWYILWPEMDPLGRLSIFMDSPILC